MISRHDKCVEFSRIRMTHPRVRAFRQLRAMSHALDAYAKNANAKRVRINSGHSHLSQSTGLAVRNNAPVVLRNAATVALANRLVQALRLGPEIVPPNASVSARIRCPDSQDATRMTTRPSAATDTTGLDTPTRRQRRCEPWLRTIYKSE